MNELVYCDFVYYDYFVIEYGTTPSRVFKVPLNQLKYTVCDVVKFKEWFSGDDDDPERRWKTIAEVAPGKLLDDLADGRLAYAMGEDEIFDDPIDDKTSWCSVGTNWFYIISGEDLKKLYCEAGND